VVGPEGATGSSLLIGYRGPLRRFSRQRADRSLIPPVVNLFANQRIGTFNRTSLSSFARPCSPLECGCAEYIAHRAFCQLGVARKKKGLSGRICDAVAAVRSLNAQFFTHAHVEHADPLNLFARRSSNSRIE
jgi:hypothetical protein